LCDGVTFARLGGGWPRGGWLGGGYRAVGSGSQRAESQAAKHIIVFSPSTESSRRTITSKKHRVSLQLLSQLYLICQSNLKSICFN
jgi:hypothetical protein